MVMMEEQHTRRVGLPLRKVPLAILDESTASQLRENLDPQGDLEIAWSGTSIEELRRDRPQVQVLLANISLLDGEPAEAMNELVSLTGAELGIALYAFAKRSTLDSLACGRIRALRSPLNVPMLRCQMMGIIARNLLSPAEPPRQSVPAAAPKPVISPPRYSAATLGKLQQIVATIDCECPNQLSVLLQNLGDFERYSKNCESLDEADAAMHRLLYEHTAQARVLMEEAMARLIEHEDIQL